MRCKSCSVAERSSSVVSLTRPQAKPKIAQMSRSNVMGGVAETPRWAAPRLRHLARVGSRVTDEVGARLVADGCDVLDLHAHPRRRLPTHVLEAVAAAAARHEVAPARGR